MKYPLMFFSFILLFIVCFVLIFTNYESAPHRLNEVVANNDLDDCYDQTMTSWFIEFNESQEKGVDMNRADQLASEKALSNYDECLANNY